MHAINQIEKWIETCYLIGDCNVNRLNYSKRREATDFVDILQSNSSVSLMNWPTRINRNDATLIDNTFTNCSNIHDTFQCFMQSDITDHFPIIHNNG